MADLIVSKVSDVYCKIDGEVGALRELVDYFTFRVPGCEFMPAYRAKMWDGNIRLYNPQTRLLYAGLIPYLDKFSMGEYDIQYDEGINIHHDVDLEDIERMAKKLNPHSQGKKIGHREYQLDALHFAISNDRALLLSPTGSGKSLIIYTLLRYYEEILKPKGKKILVIVPTTSLVHQMYNDFSDYSSEDPEWDVLDKCHMVFQGQDKIHPEKPIVISTWQSIYKMQKPYFKNFSAVLGDECLHPETPIKMGDGSSKLIKDIVVGDSVKTFNEDTKEIENNKVIKVHKNISHEKMYEVTGKNGEKLKITGNHKVLLTNGIWKRVDELKKGDVINTLNR